MLPRSLPCSVLPLQILLHIRRTPPLAFPPTPHAGPLLFWGRLPPHYVWGRLPPHHVLRTFGLIAVQPGLTHADGFPQKPEPPRASHEPPQSPPSTLARRECITPASLLGSGWGTADALQVGSLLFERGTRQSSTRAGSGLSHLGSPWNPLDSGPLNPEVLQLGGSVS